MENDKGFFGHPKGLRVLFFTEMWERFSYYGMRALLILFMTAPLAAGGLEFSTERAASIYGWYTSLVYATCIFGGWFADRFFGQRLAILWGGVIIACGHFSMAVPGLTTFYLGLALIVVGTGLLKPNISAIVGGLYATDDNRRDAGFTIFYMGINIGAFLSPFVCGYLGQKIDWHYGFAAAGVGMVLGLIQFVYGWKSLGDVGRKPDRKNERSEQQSSASAYSREEWMRIGAIGVLFIFAALFWGAFEQAGSSLNLFADRLTNNRIFGWDAPSSWYQSLNSFYIFLLAPMLAWLWVRLGRHNPSSPSKFAYGLVLVGIGFLPVVFAAHLSGPEGALVSPVWLFMVYFLHTVGELCLSPVGLSTVTKLAPARLVGSMMGVWFLASAVGNKLSGFAAGFFDSLPLPVLFLTVCGICVGAGLILFMLVKPMKNLMSGVH